MYFSFVRPSRDAFCGLAGGSVTGWVVVLLMHSGGAKKQIPGFFAPLRMTIF
jgi:hypothetical protein